MVNKNKLKGRIVERYGTVSSFAEDTGFSRQAVYNILNSRSWPKPETIRTFCDALRITKTEYKDFFCPDGQKKFDYEH